MRAPFRVLGGIIDAHVLIRREWQPPVAGLLKDL
jgi:hypothetical protein